jgi:hypothetical protein
VGVFFLALPRVFPLLGRAIGVLVFVERVFLVAALLIFLVKFRVVSSTFFLARPDGVFGDKKKSDFLEPVFDLARVSDLGTEDGPPLWLLCPL